MMKACICKVSVAAAMRPHARGWWMGRVCAMENWETGCPNVETMTTGRYIVPIYDESLKQSPPGQETKKVVSAFVSVGAHSIQGRQSMLRGRADPNIQLHCSPSARGLG